MSNSSPLAEWSVMMLTASAEASLSASMTSETCSRKPIIESNSSIERTSSLRFSSRPGASARAVGLPHLGVAGLFEDDLGELGMAEVVDLAAPAGERGEQVAERVRVRAASSSVSIEILGGVDQRHAPRPRPVVQELHRGVADAAARRVDDALEGEVVGGLGDDAEIGQRVADLLPLVEARAADDAIVEAEGDEAILEGAHLERGADEDRDLVEDVALALELLDLLADGARLLLRVPRRGDEDLRGVMVGAVGEQRLAEPALVVGDQVRGGAEDVRGRAVVPLEADDLGAGKILLEAEDVVDLGAAPAIDRLVVVADAADVLAGPGRAAAARDTARRWCPGTRRPACSGSACGSRRARPGARGGSSAARGSGRRSRRRSASSADPGRPRRAFARGRRRRRGRRIPGTSFGDSPRFFQVSIQPASWRAGQRFSSMPSAAMICFIRRIWSSVSRMVKPDLSPTSSAWRRRSLAPIEWNVPSHCMPSSTPPIRSPTRFFISRAALLVKVTARIS